MFSQEEINELENWEFDKKLQVWVNTKTSKVVSNSDTLLDVVNRALGYGE